MFFDVDTIPLGVDFRQHIDQMVAECDVVLVVIGRRWVDAVDEQGRVGSTRPGDFVRLEVEAALRREIPVVPLLVDGATIPEPDQLPESLTDLAYRNGDRQFATTRTSIRMSIDSCDALPRCPRLPAHDTAGGTRRAARRRTRSARAS